MKNIMISQRKMGRTVRKIARHVNFRWSLLERVSVFKDFFKFIWERLLVCSIRKPRGYRLLSVASSPSMEALDTSSPAPELTSTSFGYDSDSDSVALKISILGDCQIGKTSFVIKYVGDEEEKKSLQMKGLNMMDKTLIVHGARIAFRIWDVGGDQRSLDQVPIACKDAVAILFMFDLTSRTTLNSVIGWYAKAKKWNQSGKRFCHMVGTFLSLEFTINSTEYPSSNAIPILIGTKFDDFVELPPDLQWTIITQARTYAKAMKATLFFSSATHNINVNKIFKFIMAKLLNLPWTVERNLTIGEPTIDY